MSSCWSGWIDRKSTCLNSSHTVIYTLSLHDALPISHRGMKFGIFLAPFHRVGENPTLAMNRDVELLEWLDRSEEHMSELQSHSDLHSFPTRRSSDLPSRHEVRHLPGTVPSRRREPDPGHEPRCRAVGVAG